MCEEVTLIAVVLTHHQVGKVSLTLFVMFSPLSRLAAMNHSSQSPAWHAPVPRRCSLTRISHKNHFQIRPLKKKTKWKKKYRNRQVPEGIFVDNEMNACLVDEVKGIDRNMNRFDLFLHSRSSAESRKRMLSTPKKESIFRPSAYFWPTCTHIVVVHRW